MKRSRAIDCALWAILALMILIGSCAVPRFLGITPKEGNRHQRGTGMETSQSIHKQSSTNRAENIAQNSRSTIHHTTATMRTRVRTGETAVMGYGEIAPGKLGLSMVTPKPWEDGKVAVQVRTFEFADSAAVRACLPEVLPDIFELERSGVLTEARVKEILAAITGSDKDSRIVMYPQMIVPPGAPAIIRSVVTSKDTEPVGISYSIRAATAADADGYDLSIDYHHSGTPSDL